MKQRTGAGAQYSLATTGNQSAARVELEERELMAAPYASLLRQAMENNAPDGMRADVDAGTSMPTCAVEVGIMCEIADRAGTVHGWKAA